MLFVWFVFYVFALFALFALDVARRVKVNEHNEMEIAK